MAIDRIADSGRPLYGIRGVDSGHIEEVEQRSAVGLSQIGVSAGN